MRSAAQLTRTPRQWHDHQEEERRRSAAAFLSLTAAARARGDEWIRWIDDGCPQLTPEQYELVSSSDAQRRRASRREHSA